jgi:hypothetical protein
MKKGDLVKLNPNDPEIARLLEWPLGEKEYLGSRPTTPEERAAWRREKSEEIARAREAGEDTFHIAFDSSGESRLAPRSVSIPMPINDIYVVERARCRVELGWGRATGGMTKILCTKTGEVAYVRREMLEKVEDDSR